MNIPLVSRLSVGTGKALYHENPMEVQSTRFLCAPDRSCHSPSTNTPTVCSFNSPRSHGDSRSQTHPTFCLSQALLTGALAHRICSPSSQVLKSSPFTSNEAPPTVRARTELVEHRESREERECGAEVIDADHRRPLEATQDQAASSPPPPCASQVHPPFPVPLWCCQRPASSMGPP